LREARCTVRSRAPSPVRSAATNPSEPHTCGSRTRNRQRRRSIRTFAIRKPPPMQLSRESESCRWPCRCSRALAKRPELRRHYSSPSRSLPRTMATDSPSLKTHRMPCRACSRVRARLLPTQQVARLRGSDRRRSVAETHWPINSSHSTAWQARRSCPWAVWSGCPSLRWAPLPSCS